MTYTAVVIGLGRIGQGYDYEGAADSVTTHATALARHPGFELVAGVDPDPAQRARFQNKFSRPAYADCTELLSKHRPEIVSICTPTATHIGVFDVVITANPRVVICEKPLAPSVKEAMRMVAAARSQGCILLVNYMRRFEPGVQKLKMKLDQGVVGDIYKGIVYYSKGFLNNGSHYVDLLRFLLGENSGIRVVRKGRSWDGKDPEPDVCMQFGDADVYFIALREECFSAADMVLTGTRGQVHYLDGGNRIQLRHPEPDPLFPGYSVLSQRAEEIASDFGRYQWHVYDQLYRHLTENAALHSTGDTAIGTLQVVENVFTALTD